MKYVLYCLIILVGFICMMCDRPASTPQAATTGITSRANDSTIRQEIIKVSLPGPYPGKEIYLQDIAEVRYLPLETNDKSLFKNIRRVAMRDDKIIITDYSNQVLVFDSAGKFISKIARSGFGPQEYQTMANTAVDFDKGLVYVEDVARFLVYDFDGHMIKRIPKPDYVSASMLYVFDSDKLIAYYETKGIKEEGDTLRGNYFFINSETGERRPAGIEIPEPASNTIMEIHDDGVSISKGFPIKSMLKTDGKVIISDYIHPNVYESSPNGLNKIIERKVNDDAKWLSTVNMISEPYILFRAVKISKDEGMSQHLISLHDFLYNCETNEMVEVEIYNHDINTSASQSIEGWGHDVPKNTIVEPMNSDLLMTLNDKGKLTGALKALVDTLDEDANDILMIVTLKTD